MNRGYTVEEYMKKVDHLRNLNPHISITSDIIVGFPGETQDDYQETIDMMKKSGLIRHFHLSILKEKELKHKN